MLTEKLKQKYYQALLDKNKEYDGVVHEQHLLLKGTWLDSPLGPMLAVADEKELYLLEFVERRGLEREIERLRLRLKAAIVPGMTEPLRSIDRELKSYFEGKL